MQTEYDYEDSRKESFTNLEVNYKEEKDERVKQQLKHAFKYCISKNFTYTNEGMRIVFDDKEIDNLRDSVLNIFEQDTPLIYLNKNQRDKLLADIFYVKVVKDSSVIYQCVEDTK